MNDDNFKPLDYKYFTPFYEPSIPDESSTQYLPDFVMKIVGSFLIGGIVLAFHFWRIKFVVFENYGWLLSVIITVALLALFYATHTFRSLLPQLGARLSPTDQDDFKKSISNSLSNKKFVMFGLLFGIANCVMGFIFGLPEIYNDFADKAALLISYFTAGFVCGLPLLGIIGVTQCLSMPAKKMDVFFDYTSPDGCGGTQFLGGALVVFSSITMIVGVLISVYILKTAWHPKIEIWVFKLLCLGWILLPYLMGLFILLVPAIAINSALSNYKLNKEVQFAKELTAIRNKLEQGNLNTEERKMYSDDYEFQIKLRNQLHGMRTWPFSSSANLAYFASVATSAGLSINSVIQWIKPSVKLILPH